MPASRAWKASLYPSQTIFFPLLATYQILSFGLCLLDNICCLKPHITTTAHHASHILYAPIARPYGVADSKSSSTIFLDQVWQALRQGQHWYVQYPCNVDIGDKKLTATTIGHTFRRSAAGAFGPDLAKKLSQLVKMEKNVMRSMELVGRERMESAVSQTISSHMQSFALTCRSNNCHCGVKPATTTSQMSRTSSVYSSTRLASSRTNSSTATTSTASR